MFFFFFFFFPFFPSFFYFFIQSKKWRVIDRCVDIFLSFMLLLGGKGDDPKATQILWPIEDKEIITRDFF